VGRSRCILLEALWEMPSETSEKKSDAELQLEEILDNAQDHVELDADCWTAAVFCFVNDLPKYRHGKFPEERMLRSMFVMICYVLNIGLQVGLLYFIATMVMLPAVRRYQELYKGFHVNAFDGEIYDDTKFDAMGDDRKPTCELSLNEPFFIAAILFLWTAQMVDELRSIYRLCLQISALPPVPGGLPSEQMAVETTEGEGHFEQTLNLFCCCDMLTRFMIWTFVLIPRFVIAITLLLLGCTWLIASDDFGNLILNALALAFVTDIDETIFGSFLPPILADKIGDFRIAQPLIRPGEEHLSDEEREQKDIMRVYKRSAFFLFLTAGFVVVFVAFQPVIPHFLWDVTQVCEEFLHRSSVPWCHPLSKDECFPTGKNGSLHSMAVVSGRTGKR
jgi:hypothetical protein